MLKSLTIVQARKRFKNVMHLKGCGPKKGKIVIVVVLLFVGLGHFRNIDKN